MQAAPTCAPPPNHLTEMTIEERSAFAHGFVGAGVAGD
jgi:hypothetical protein